jgi:hypothetical protein
LISKKPNWKNAGKKLSPSAIHLEGINADLMDVCMRDAGYRFDVSHKDCELKPNVPFRVNAYCYVPATKSRYWLYRAEMMFHTN